MTTEPSDQGEKRLPGHCPPHGERLEYTTSDRGSSEPGCTCVRRYVPAVPAVPSDHTATTEDAALDAATEAVEAEFASIHAGSDHGARDVAEAAVHAYLATAPSTATTEDAAKVLDDVIQHLRKIWAPAVDYADEHEVIDTAEVLLGQALPLLATARPDTTTEWGVRWPNGNVQPLYGSDEAEARRESELLGVPLISREVTAWTEAE